MEVSVNICWTDAIKTHPCNCHINRHLLKRKIRFKRQETNEKYLNSQIIGMLTFKILAYNPSEPQPTRVGASRWFRPSTQVFHVAEP